MHEAGQRPEGRAEDGHSSPTHSHCRHATTDAVHPFRHGRCMPFMLIAAHRPATCACLPGSTARVHARTRARIGKCSVPSPPQCSARVVLQQHVFLRLHAGPGNCIFVVLLLLLPVIPARAPLRLGHQCGLHRRHARPVQLAQQPCMRAWACVCNRAGMAWCEGRRGVCVCVRPDGAAVGGLWGTLPGVQRNTAHSP